MSAIAVIFERDGAPASQDRMAAMQRRLRHRGPDGQRESVAGCIALGHSKLSTTPEDAFDEPQLFSGARRPVIVADVRLDNRDELLALRKAGGLPSEGLSDAALVLYAYETWGEACPERLLGDFAFAIWDAKERRLFCARDHLGVRQLYHHADDRTFRCATEPHALFADDRIPRRPHALSIGLYLLNEYAERDNTLWQDVHALPAGHAMTVTPSSIARRAFWRPNSSRRAAIASDAGYAERFRDVFTEAVRCRLRASTRVAAHVSGGLDSSSVVSVASLLRAQGRGLDEPIDLLHLGFPGLPCDESPFVRAVARRWDLPHTTLSVRDDRELCRPVLAHPDLYFFPTARCLAPMFSAARERGIRTSLTGIGGDQLMRPTGDEAASLLREGRVGEAFSVSGIAGAPLSRRAWGSFARQAARAFVPRRALHAAARAKTPASVRYPWLARRLAADVLAHEQALDARMAALHPDPVRAELCRGLVHAMDTPLVLAVADRGAALWGQELRHPFLDVRVIDLLLSLPNEQRYEGGLAKPVLRRALDGILPVEVRDRRDAADFRCYVRTALFGEHGNAISTLFRDSRLAEHGLIDGGAARRMLAAHDTFSNMNLLVNIVGAEVWLRRSLSPTTDIVTP